MQLETLPRDNPMREKLRGQEAKKQGVYQNLLSEIKNQQVEGYEPMSYGLFVICKSNTVEVVGSNFTDIWRWG